MLTDHFRDPRTLDRIQSTAAAPYLDVFADALTKAGYKRTTIQRYLGAAAHLSFWQQNRARLLTELDGSNVGEFKQHLLACKCVGFRRVNELDARGARLFLLHLQKLGVIARAAVTPVPLLFVGFCDWMRQYRGTQDTTLNTYRRTILDALKTLGSEPQRFDAAGLRAFVLDRASLHGRCQAKVVITALRALVRYLIATGQCQVGLDASIPTIAGWRLSAMPRYISAADVERVVAACDPTTAVGARDRAILFCYRAWAYALAILCASSPRHRLAAGHHPSLRQNPSAGQSAIAARSRRRDLTLLGNCASGCEVRSPFSPVCNARGSLCKGQHRGFCYC
jgi:integrase/recombinase XerD